MRFRLLELQDNNEEAKALRSDITGLLEGWKNDEEVLQYRDLAYVPEIICSKMISYHYNNPLAKHFGINKTQKLVAKKYY